MVRPLILAVAILVALAARAVATECRDDPYVVDQCFKVHGRIMVYADMRAFLWPVGTHRLLEFDYPPEGPGSHYPYIPKKLFDLLSGSMVVYGDFEVCPFTYDKPGVVRFICIQSVSNMVVGPQSLQHRDPLAGEDKSKFHHVD